MQALCADTIDVKKEVSSNVCLNMQYTFACMDNCVIFGIQCRPRKSISISLYLVEMWKGNKTEL